MEILQKVKELAKERNISITNLEIKSGIGNGTLGKWNEIKGLPNLSTIKAVADALGVPVSELIE